MFFIKEVLLKKFDVPSLVNTICTFTDKNICDPETLDDVRQEMCSGNDFIKDTKSDFKGAFALSFQ